MARAWFGKTSADFLYDATATGNLHLDDGVVTFWDAETGGSQHVSLQLGGSPVSTITVSTTGLLPLFEGPDNVYEMWADAGGERVKIISNSIGGATNAATAGFVSGAGATRDAVDARVAASTVAVNRTSRAHHATALGLYFPEAEGAVNDGTTNDATAINAAAAAAAAAGGTLHCQGSYGISATVTLACDVDALLATFNWTGANTGLAVQIGVGTSGVYLFSKTIVCPRVINTMKVGTGWAGSSVGIKAINTLQCTITVSHVSGFVTNYYAYGLGTGNVGNTVHLRSLENGKRNLAIGAGTAGWCNSNTYLIGWFAHFSNEGTNVSGTRQIELETATNIVNGNLFIGGTIEGDVAEYHIDCDGLQNQFLGLRYETTGGARVRWKANGDDNVIRGGYGAQNIVETWVAGAGQNHIYTTSVSYLMSGTSGAVQVLENQTSGAFGADAVMDPGARVAGSSPATAYRVLRTANSTKMKQAADATDRLVLNHDTGQVLMGIGSGGTPWSIGLVSGSPEGVITANIGSIRLRIDGGASTTLYVKTSGTGNTGWTAK